MYIYSTNGVCSKEINFDVIDDKISNVRFLGGCNGNLQGLAKLLEGMEVDDAIQRLKGIDCGGRGTSCPDQFATALKNLVVNDK